jgi:hypothetical protein
MYASRYLQRSALYWNQFDHRTIANKHFIETGDKRMSKALRISLIIIGAFVISGALLWTGFLIGRSAWSMSGFWPGSMMGVQSGYGSVPNVAQFPYGMMGGEMMSGYGGAGMMGPGMMSGYGGAGMMGPGMMSGYGGAGMMGPGMMSGYGGAGMMGVYASSGLSAVEPLSIEQTQKVLEAYLNRLNDPDLEIKEVMIFENHAYAEIVEKSTGIGAMEVLVDPVTLAVYPEHGPNMMWNLKYGMMGNGMMGDSMMEDDMMEDSMTEDDMMEDDMMEDSMMDGRGQNSGKPQDISAEMPVSPDRAVEIAQGYLDSYLPGDQADDHADVFYGYYTLHLLRDGKVVGMLSVNGYTGQVFPHTWHGDFVEMSTEE